MSLKLQSLFYLLIFSALSCSKNETEEIKPTLGAVTESVYASGVIKAEGQYTVYATVNGTLQKVNVIAGQSITKGQSLFELESDKAELNTENARLAYQLSLESSRYIQDKIAEMEMKVQSSRDKLTLDESIYNRNKNVRNQGGISEVDFERVELAYKSSKINHESAKKQLAQLKAQLKNDQSRNSVNLRINQKSQSDFSVKSAFSGQLFDILVKEGTLITPQTPLAIIGQSDSFVLELEVDENDMVRVSTGQKVLVTMDSYKGQVFDALVDKIYPIMNERSRTFKIEAHFVKPPQKLYPNLTAEANIIIQIKQNIITIPKSYLIEGKYVLVDKDEKREVKTGLSDYQKVEIVSGLTAEETIYKPK
ncbi:efflux RND transporter periplasmic adaptor subunit [Flavobacterium caseinilyticum]|uniref:HlyD family efflux transporter periplasmic adaptor subunit n=1 Tax=Flavobacterium caseinilyticum TaxID=2541732 RepID=A0A4R5AUJ7_9FLAO|nr:efflux RND transporter periplasmic adaptor subunit [Flavobacterium caseinilyticum]TDD77028.1 HlyD family efflux transporter periplasmic adaptor subunit [Flavobacterium caseinilyticum]